MFFRRARVETMQVVQAGEPVLRSRARPLTAEEMRSASTRDLIERMRVTMQKAPGVGLAAPQVGLSLRLIVIEDHAQGELELLSRLERRPVPFHALANPVMTWHGDEVAEFFEGCLSVPPYRALVPRWREIRVQALGAEGNPVEIEAQGWYARILQHEIDHLEGMLYVDRMIPRTLSTLDNVGRFWSQASAEEVRAALGVGRTGADEAPGP